VERAAARYVKAGAVGVELAPERARLAVHLKGLVDGDFFRRTAAPIDRMLRRTPTTLALHIEALRESALPEVRRWLSGSRATATACRCSSRSAGAARCRSTRRSSTSCSSRSDPPAA
jgi:hypothetical protein